MKYLYISLLIICLIGTISWAGDLKHIFYDAMGWDLSINDSGECIEDKHFYIRLQEGDWNVIWGGDKDFKREYAHWSGLICIKCRRINISCNGNDVFRYVIKTEGK